MLGVGDELSDEDRADGSGIESVQAAEIKDHSIGARLESILETAGEPVGVRPAEIAGQFDPDHVVPVGDAYLKPRRSL